MLDFQIGKLVLFKDYTYYTLCIVNCSQLTKLNFNLYYNNQFYTSQLNIEQELKINCINKNINKIVHKEVREISKYK